MTRVPVTEAPPPAQADNRVSIQRQRQQQQPDQQPPPSYASFFKVKTRRGNNNNNRPSNYFPWPLPASSSASPLRRPESEGAAYDMTDFVSIEEVTTTTEYIRIDGPSSNEAAAAAGAGAVAVVAPAEGGLEEGADSHEAALRVPLLGRAE
jgi:hypothetical protein